VTSIKYIDTAGTEQTLAASEYTVDGASEPGRIVPAYNVSWPSTRGHINDVTVRFVAGYTGSAMPQSIHSAMLLIVGELFERREHGIVGSTITSVPFSAQHLLWPYRMLTL
jgi:uncharacterized phiE125 gp8 family phage protein